MKPEPRRIAGRDRSDVMLAAGFCLGMSTRPRLEEHEVRILKTAGEVLREVAKSLYTPEEPTAKP